MKPCFSTQRSDLREVKEGAAWPGEHCHKCLGRQVALYKGRREAVVRLGVGVWRKEASLPKGDERDT